MRRALFVLALVACGRASPGDAGPASSATTAASAGPGDVGATTAGSAPSASVVASASAAPSASLDPDEDDEPAPPSASAATPSATASGSGKPAPSAKVAAAPSASSKLPKLDPKVPRCRVQKPQAFLVRANYTPIGAHKEAHDKAIAFRTQHYGWVKGFGDPKQNPHAPSHYVTDVHFMGLTVKLHPRIAPALACAEQAILKHCGAFPYTPGVLAGIRYENTYKGGEVTNHMYGIALDIDPGRNTCCNCVPPWRDHPLCKKKLPIEQRMAMPMCWVKQFEKFGWYWLGRDKLEDTMHFEFLGDPGRILLK